MNAKNELLESINTPKLASRVKAATIDFNFGEKIINLPLNYSDEEWHAFLSYMDFNYEFWHNGLKLKGFVWFEDGTWLERRVHEYEGSEWWHHSICPEIPKNLIS